MNIQPTAPACPPVDLNAIAVRRWLGRNLAVTGGLVFAAGGGRAYGRVLDTYFGVGPTFGVSLLLANWRHLAISASPDLAVVGFRASGDGNWRSVTDLRADLEAELHFGFIGLPALALGIRSGILFRLEHADKATLWSIGVTPGNTVSALMNRVLLRYYF